MNVSPTYCKRTCFHQIVTVGVVVVVIVAVVSVRFLVEIYFIIYL